MAEVALVVVAEPKSEKRKKLCWWVLGEVRA